MEKAGSTVTSYIYGPGGLPVEQIAGSTTTYLHHDQIGSTVLIDSAGATGTATTNTFDPYGNVVSTSGSLTTPLMFAGQYLNSESGLYYNRARYYQPSTGQFMSLDPAVGKTMSPYAYVLGNPLNGTDPSGLDRTINTVAGTPYNGPTTTCYQQGAAGAMPARPSAASHPRRRHHRRRDRRRLVPIRASRATAPPRRPPRTVPTPLSGSRNDPCSALSGCGVSCAAPS
jgi:RHS repeat-associated protein